MTRPVRLFDGVDADVARQLEPRRVERFCRYDLAAALVLLSRPSTWEDLPSHGGGRRLTLEGLTVGAFHLFVTLDELDPRPGALVVYALDIWPEGFADVDRTDR